MSEQINFPSNDTITNILDVVIPNYKSFSIHELPGSYSNMTHLLKVDIADTENRQIVLRQYNVQNGDTIGKANREYRALQYLKQSDLPTPTPLLLDDTGQFFGSPGIVTEFIRGHLINIVTSPSDWVTNIDVIAKTLARIHTIPIDEDLQAYLMNGNIEAAWFIKKGSIPEYMRQDPDGVMIWKTVSKLLATQTAIKPSFLHIDYWSGNILWDDGKISAVLDWEEAGFGDPAIDVAYCRMELYLEGLDEAADRFLHIYEETSGKRVENLGLWELAAAVRPMTSLDDWLTRPHMGDRFRRFIASAKQRVDSK